MDVRLQPLRFCEDSFAFVAEFYHISLQLIQFGGIVATKISVNVTSDTRRFCNCLL